MKFKINVFIHADLFLVGVSLLQKLLCLFLRPPTAHPTLYGTFPQSEINDLLKCIFQTVKNCLE